LNPFNTSEICHNNKPGIRVIFKSKVGCGKCLSLTAIPSVGNALLSDVSDWLTYQRQCTAAHCAAEQDFRRGGSGGKPGLMGVILVNLYAFSLATPLEQKSPGLKYPARKLLELLVPHPINRRMIIYSDRFLERFMFQTMDMQYNNI
jgi:hypothetical protein